MDEVDFGKNIFDFDKEDNILNCMLMFMEPKDNILLFNNNEFERQVLKYFQEYRAFTPNAGHDCLPPDYYSDTLSCMFDVMRVNATEENKTNPVKKEERKIINSYRNMKYDDNDDTKVFNAYDADNIHVLIDVDGMGISTYEKYKKQAKRVIENHIHKIPIWVREHPTINYKGLVICDESDLCFEAETLLSDGSYKYNPYDMVIHEAWRDIDFMRPIYESELDFVVWFSMSKIGSLKLRPLYDYSGYRYPAITIVDTRTPPKYYKAYNCERLVF